MRQKWSAEIVISAIQELDKKGELLNSNKIQTKNNRLYSAAIRYFDGWPQAVTAAGLNYDEVRCVVQRTWTKDLVAKEILSRVEAGLSIRGEIVSKEDRGLYQAARRHFGRKGWSKARVYAGLTPLDPKPQQIWNEETVVQEILRLYSNGVSLNTGGLQESEYRKVHEGGRKVFGTWEKAIEASGLNYEEIRKGRKNFWTKDKIKLEIRNLESNGIRLSSKAIQISNCDLFGAAVFYFGCWSQAVEAAGISYRRHCRTFSTKAWLRRMNPDEYQAVLDSSSQQAHTRRRNTT